MEVKTKECSKCKKTLDIGEFCRRSKSSMGVRSACKECAAAQKREYLKSPGGKKSAIRKDLKYRYGLSLEDRELMRKNQEGVCAICKTLPAVDKNRTTSLFVDHCHTTGSIRGLLCNSCNSLLGHSKDNIGILQSAINYLEKHNPNPLVSPQPHQHKANKEQRRGK